MAEPPKHDSGLTHSNSNVNYHPAAPPQAVCGTTTVLGIPLYCYRICPDIMSTQLLLWVVIWALCMEIDRCPHAISDSVGIIFIPSKRHIEQNGNHIFFLSLLYLQADSELHPEHVQPEGKRTMLILKAVHKEWFGTIIIRCLVTNHLLVVIR